MSTDVQIRQALALKTNEAIRYFEVVKVDTPKDKKKCFICLGRHAMIFMKQDLAGKVKFSPGDNEGVLAYSDVAKVAQDTMSSEILVLVLKDNNSWQVDHLRLRSENRDLLLSHLRCSWQTDYMFKFNKVANFPSTKVPLSKPQKMDPPVKAFKEHRWEVHEGYKFMLHDDFKEKPNAVQTNNTGEYYEQGTGVTVSIHVHKVMTMEHLLKTNREHIRWVAAEYKINLSRDVPHFYVLRNGVRAKRMNLCSDMAAWYGWEIVIRTREETIVCMLLRRQYLPPLCDCAQDLAIITRCSAEYWTTSEVRVLLQTALVVDSMSPNSSVSVYPELVQCKLDALRLDEDGTEWIYNRLKVTSRLRTEAKRFLRGIIKLFADEGVQTFREEVADKASKEPGSNKGPKIRDLLEENWHLSQASTDEDWKDIDASLVFDDESLREGLFFKRLRLLGEGLEDGSRLFSGGKKDFLRQARNRWLARVARYFAWAVDGGLLGPRFTIDLLIDNIVALSDRGEEKVFKALLFLLHMRRGDDDWSMDGTFQTLTETLSKEDPQGIPFSFNDRVMQEMINAELLKKQYGREKEKEYIKCLANLLKSNAGVGLKAYVCRTFMEMRADRQGGASAKDDEANSFAVPALLKAADSGNLYLSTYATAALVNLSHGNEFVKMQLMRGGLAKLAVINLKTKDDDLICYTLTLLVNLTKEAHHRFILAGSGLLLLLYDILTSTYHQCKTAGAHDSLGSSMLGSAVKEKILSQVCSLIGHFCKDEVYRDQLLDKMPNTVRCVVYICEHTLPSGPLMCKVLFALRQLCAENGAEKLVIGGHLIMFLMNLLQDVVGRGAKVPNSAHAYSAEFLHSVLLLLATLVEAKDNCKKMHGMTTCSYTEVLNKLKNLPAAKDVDGLDDLVQCILDTVMQVVAREEL